MEFLGSIQEYCRTPIFIPYVLKREILIHFVGPKSCKALQCSKAQPGRLSYYHLKQEANRINKLCTQKIFQ